MKGLWANKIIDYASLAFLLRSCNHYSLVDRINKSCSEVIATTVTSNSNLQQYLIFHFCDNSFIPPVLVGWDVCTRVDVGLKIRLVDRMVWIVIWEIALHTTDTVVIFIRCLHIQIKLWYIRLHTKIKTAHKTLISLCKLEGWGRGR